jgi:uncharacterized protein
VTDITPPVPAGSQIIQAYGEGGFRIGGADHAGSVLVLPGQTLPWAAAVPPDVTEASLAPLLDAEFPVELLLIGYGRAIARPDAALRNALRARGIALEPMDTGAACRTFNVLLSEQRAVAAALIAI